ncbi:DUF2732 family protein [Pantoea agglomerans pv. betae]|jgi:hypothetical protein|uniref:DUF2732 family protein n=1 Tax=Enterobacter agglomerans TaxID=549 RepID=UPI0007E596C8|nr:DUF2732 family protein [Pantoea agglomerans]WHU84785.1 DUF2732 family protein [Pantoea agglomerans pv. betae]
MKLTTPKEFYELPLDVMLRDVRLDERRSRAELMASRLNVLAWKISSGELNHVEAAELLRQESEKLERQAQELH